MVRALHLVFICFIFPTTLFPQEGVKLIPVGPGWANNSINTVIFRKNSLATYKDTQYIAFYDARQNVVLGKRKLGSQTWEIKTTGLKGKATDAHNTISMIIDGDGYLHMAWNHHNNSLHYVKSIAPGSLELTNELSMTGMNESNLSYPEFYSLPGGDLLFLYRDGSSGQGNMVVNRYNVKSRKWTQLHDNLVDGENTRNAYWQACVDAQGVIRLSWVWRETPDVASNHDLCYAQSKDGGQSWQRSDGTSYKLPITIEAAETVCRIPQGSELINQTSMTTNGSGQPIIGSYWKDAETEVPQYHIIIKRKEGWKVLNTGFLHTNFSLGGTGTRQIPISRPQILSWTKNGKTAVAIFFRAEERGNRVSVALNTSIENNQWRLKELTVFSVSSWEPTLDSELWKQRKKVSLFVQKVEQVSGEGQANVEPQLVQVLEWDPFFKK